MAKIRAYNFFDSIKIKRMFSILDCCEDDDKNKTELPFLGARFFHWFLPASLKFLSEAYCAIEDDKLEGIIVLRPNRGNWRKWKIKKLILRENAEFVGRQLVEYVITKYGASGVNTFIVNIEDTQQEVLELFSKGCNFKFCSVEQLWKLEKINLSEPKIDNYIFRKFKDKDAKEVCQLYNDSIHAQYRNSLCKEKEEFYDNVFYGLEKTSTNKFVIEDKNTKKISGYVLLKTDDNINFLLELTLSEVHNENLNEIIGFAIYQISKKVSSFNLFVINKKYKQNGNNFEEYLKSNNFQLVQSQAVFVKDYFKKIKSENSATSIVFTNIKGKLAYNRLQG